MSEVIVTNSHSSSGMLVRSSRLASAVLSSREASTPADSLQMSTSSALVGRTTLSEKILRRGISTTPVSGCLIRRGERNNAGIEGEDALGTKRLRAGGSEEPIQHQRASSAPGLLQAAAAPQLAALPQVALVVQRLDLLRRQVEPAPPLFTLRTDARQREDAWLATEVSSLKSKYPHRKSLLNRSLTGVV